MDSNLNILKKLAKLGKKQLVPIAIQEGKLRVSNRTVIARRPQGRRGNLQVLRLLRPRLARRLAMTILLATFTFSAAAWAADGAQPINNEECLACHDTINPQKFAASIHSSNRCTSCHSDVQEVPHSVKPGHVECASCHRIEAQIYNASDHGKALKKGAPAASCLDCHGNAHELLNYRNPDSPVNRKNIPATCATCHENQEKMLKYGLLEARPLKSYSESVHGKALLEKGVISSAECTDCHGSHDLHAPTNVESKIYRTRVPQTCGKCHENVLRTYERSVHGKAALSGKLEAPVCTDCHGEHRIKSHLDPTSTVFAGTLSEKTCGHCHAAEKIITKYRLPPDSVETYLKSYHGLAGRFGDVTVANCASCHGAHDILPSSDPNSSVNKKNLPKTCGKCHPGVGEQLTKGTVHVVPTSTENRIVFYVSRFYIVLISLVIGGMLIHNVLDFLKKLKAHYAQKKSSDQYLRFTKGERIQHLVLTLVFIILAYTGFALEYPKAWWAYPFNFFEGGGDWRGIIHRAAAVVFVALSLHHLIFMMFTRRGRKVGQELALKKKDFADVTKTLSYNLGRLKEKPHYGRYSYVEKIEYWALVWGTLIMIITGTMLTFENVFLTHLPKWALDVATKVHFYEAVLATLAIVVWHFYFVIFDPDHYPMNWSMVTGKVSEGEKGLENKDTKG
ncbi:MAG: cytochrome b/b6 domain-containing protein [Candidatus Omnitrophica bacterium]|nr:cytochrome b/b6 domain-containing protein [Candidatus Omnitrophota bacterium]